MNFNIYAGLEYHAKRREDLIPLPEGGIRKRVFEHGRLEFPAVSVS